MGKGGGGGGWGGPGGAMSGMLQDNSDTWKLGAGLMPHALICVPCQVQWVFLKDETFPQA